MKRKMMLMLLAGAIALCLFGCKRKEPGAVGEANAPAATQRERETAREGTTVPTVPPTQPEQPAQPGAAGTAQDALVQQRTEYVQGAEKMLNSMEQKLNTWQQQAGAQGQQDQQKMQELSKQAQEQLADARAAVDKMRSATGTQLKEAKLAADRAIQGAQEAFKNLQSYMETQTQVTQAQ